MSKLRILLIVAIQTIALGWMILDRQQMLDSSRSVTLKVVPVDPRDLFRGDYVVLNYDISRLDIARLDGTNTMAPGNTIYVRLRRTGEGWTAIALSDTLEQPSDTEISLRAQVLSMDAPGNGASQFITLSYGIESYFVPQGTGLAIEESAREGTITIDAAVDEKGRAAIKAIRQDGKPVYVEGIL
jgi:uncharacterized membrane-anchored protein